MRRSNIISRCRRILLAVFALLLAACSSGGQIMDGEDMVRSYTQISQDEAKEMMEQDDGHVIVDVRRPDEFETGHIPGAICIPNETIGSDQPEELPDLNQVILVYCRSGNRSKQAAQKLFELGYTKVTSYMTACARKIAKIRTGGQSGVDRAAIDFAIEHGIPYCGWCPKDGWAEDYPDPPGLLRDYPELQETPSSGTGQRTRWNMRDADAILTIIPESAAESKGTEAGLEEGALLGKPMFTASGLKDVPEILRWISTLSDGTELCVGGPRASECPEAYEIAKAVLCSVIDNDT